MSAQLYGIISDLLDGTTDPDSLRGLTHDVVAHFNEKELAYSGVATYFTAPLLAARAAGLGNTHLDAALAWIDRTWGIACAVPAATVALGLWGTADLVARWAVFGRSDDLYADDLDDMLGPEFIPSVIWLITALTATEGKSDVNWLRRLISGRADA